MDTSCLDSWLNHFLYPSDRGFEAQTAIDPIKYTRAYYVEYCCDAGYILLVAEPGSRLG
jgi:hypothetical protein